MTAGARPVQPPAPIRTQRSTVIATARRRRTIRNVLVVVLLLVCAADVTGFARPEPPPAEIELSEGWQLTSARDTPGDGPAISSPDYRPTGWHDIPQMPATVLDALQQDGTFRDLYVGDNLVEKVPQDLWQQDWWYRTSFTAPGGHSTYSLDFTGINYRAEVWLNGRQVAGSTDVVGMHTTHELDVSQFIRPGTTNALAVKVTPERSLQDIDGVELADSWWDWINWNYLGYKGPDRDPVRGNSYVADRNAGIWQPVYLRMSGPVTVGPTQVVTDLPLPRTDSARLTIDSSVRNTSVETVKGVVRATISRPGKADVRVEQRVSLAPGEDRRIAFTPDDFAALTVENPDLWWPYTLGDPNLYDLDVQFWRYNQVSDAEQQRFGIRSVVGHRDDTEQFPQFGAGGDFYLTVNGRDLLVRGAAYAPDLLFHHDPDRETAILRYVKDLGLNMVRFEGKFPGRHMVETADEMGIPLMYGWMCCNQWEKWSQWDAEDLRVAQESLRSQILAIRGHPSVFLWANGSDGRPPRAVVDMYHGILADLGWQNAVVDTVSSINVDANGERVWDGIQMSGPYTWRPPAYWFSNRYDATRGSTAEQGDNEHVPPLASLQKFIPPDKLWPINDAWYVHAGSNPDNGTLASIQLAVDQRYGNSTSAEEFTRKAQVAHYESTRAQFEAFAAKGWATNKMTIYWMLNSHWPSFFGNIFDYYLRPGGAYYGAKQGLRPLTAVFDSYADGATANVTVVNQTAADQRGLRVRVRTYDTSGTVRDDRTADGIDVTSGGTARALTLPRTSTSPVFFVRVELFDAADELVGSNVYWQSQRRDDVGSPENDWAFQLRQTSWADMTALNTMPRVPLRITAARTDKAPGAVTIRLHNPTRQIAFFTRAEITATRDGDEILPITYGDNYVTVFPGETVDIDGVVPPSGASADWVRVTGYNTPAQVVPIDPRLLR